MRLEKIARIVIQPATVPNVKATGRAIGVMVMAVRGAIEPAIAWCVTVAVIAQNAGIIYRQSSLNGLDCVWVVR